MKDKFGEYIKNAIEKGNGFIYTIYAPKGKGMSNNPFDKDDDESFFDILERMEKNMR